MKKAFALLLACVLTLSLVACGGGKTETPKEETTKTEEPAKKEEAPKAEETKVDYPTKPITMIVPFGAGGGTDVMARAIATAVDLPQPITVTNIEGGGSSIGAMEAYHADPDGHTLFCVGLEPIIAGV